MTTLDYYGYQESTAFDAQLPVTEEELEKKDFATKEELPNLDGVFSWAGSFDELPSADGFKNGDIVRVGTIEYALTEKDGKKTWDILGDEGKKIATTDIEDGAVTSAKIANGGVAAANLMDGVVGIAKLAQEAVTEAKIADNAVVTAKIADKAITAEKIADGVIPTVPAKVSELENDAKYITAKDVPTLPDGTIATQEWVEGQNFLTEHQPLTDYAKKSEVPSVEGFAKTADVESTYLKKAEAVEAYQAKGDYATKEALAEYAKKNEMPSLDGYATETWVGQQGFLTTHQSLDGYAKTAEVANTYVTKADFDALKAIVDKLNTGSTSN